MRECVRVSACVRACVCVRVRVCVCGGRRHTPTPLLRRGVVARPDRSEVHYAFCLQFSHALLRTVLHT